MAFAYFVMLPVGIPWLTQVMGIKTEIRPSSYEETQIVKNYAETLGVPFYYGEGDAVGLSKNRKKNLEEAARELRFHFSFLRQKQNMDITKLQSLII